MKQRQGKIQKIFYKTTGPISSTNQCRFEKGRGRETVIESYNLIQGMVLDWILIGKKGCKAHFRTNVVSKLTRP